MPYAAALSVHPVSSHATGEVVGRLFEAVGPGQDLLVVLATPGHRGALEDIVATARHLLAPSVLLAAVTAELGAGDDYVERGPGLAAWSGSCGPVATLGPPTSSPDFEPTGALALCTSEPGADLALRLGGGLPLVVGTVAGPVAIDGATPGPGPVGVLFGPGSGFGAATAHGLRGLGPGLTVTSADGVMLYELDGRPALRQLIDAARDGMAAADLPTLSDGLHLLVTVSDSGLTTAPLPVLGADRTNGAIALAGPVEMGEVVQFAVPDPTVVPADLRRSLVEPPDGAIVLTPAGAGHVRGASARLLDPDHIPDLDGWELDGWDLDRWELDDPDSPLGDRDPDGGGFFERAWPLPASTLYGATEPPRRPARARSHPRLTTTTAAYFT